jgi:hypothetical protein
MTLENYAAVSTESLEKLGLRPHPDPVAEAASLGSVDVPERPYAVTLPGHVLKCGRARWARGGRARLGGPAPLAGACLGRRGAWGHAGCMLHGPDMQAFALKCCPCAPALSPHQRSGHIRGPVPGRAAGAAAGSARRSAAPPAPALPRRPGPRRRVARLLGAVRPQRGARAGAREPINTNQRALTPQACARHEVMLPDGCRGGFFLGDGARPTSVYVY